MRCLQKAATVIAGGYRCKDDGFLVRLYGMATYRGARVSGVRLRTIGGSAGKVDESECGAALEDATGFHEILMICNNCRCAKRLLKT